MNSSGFLQKIFGKLFLTNGRKAGLFGKYCGSKRKPFAEVLGTAIDDYSMPEVFAELILYSRRYGGSGWAPWEASLTAALSEAAGEDEVAELVGKPARKDKQGMMIVSTTKLGR